MDTELMFSSVEDCLGLDPWDSLMSDEKSQNLFDMLDEDIAYLSESKNTLIQDIMWNSPGESNYSGFDSDNGAGIECTSVNNSSLHSFCADQSSMSPFAQNQNYMDTEFYDRIFSKKIAEDYPTEADFNDFEFNNPSPISDPLYGSSASSPLSIDSCDPDHNITFDDTGFNSDIDVDNLISSLQPNTFTGFNTQSSAQMFMNQLTSFDITSSNVSSKAQGRSIISNSTVQTRKNARKSSGRIVASSRGESLIMRSSAPTGPVQKTKAKTGPKTTSAVSMLSSRMPAGFQASNASVESRKSSQFTQIKQSFKNRQAVRDCSALKSNNSTSLSLLSTQDAMLKGASSLISPPISPPSHPVSSDSEESVMSMEDSRQKNMLKKKRMPGAGSACSGRANILTSIQPGALTGAPMPRLHTQGSVAPQAQTNQQGSRPLKRREHNDSERKRRDHLRTAFDELRKTVPKLNGNERKPARIMILAEAASYAREITELEALNQQKMKEALAEQQRLQKLLDHYSAHGLM